MVMKMMIVHVHPQHPYQDLEQEEDEEDDAEKLPRNLDLDRRVRGFLGRGNPSLHSLDGMLRLDRG